jgi:hypothetical protein
VNSGFLPDVRHGLVHFQGFRNRLASIWKDPVALKTAQQPETGQNMCQK